ncbi:hypothetical protein AVEN_156347-1 [Araneus ventricosus]|uniref:Retrovirus-related Pol polyprotein from transposon TNT 1-94 n=1 Tax=Araneus ventricosus TaxID=182803 RepID=A0A4Y2NZJ5_ARAVE|nr:hypothetical protein AVEN_156347-1 [Araneus ventricosus]
MRICKEVDGYTLEQTAYVSEILETFKMTEARHATIPLDPSIKYNKVDDHQWEEIKHRSKETPIDRILGACYTSPVVLVQIWLFLHPYEPVQREAYRRTLAGVKHIFRYLKGTRQRKLKFRKTGEPLQIYFDADWGGDRTDRKLCSGYIMLLAGAPISWSSKKQPIQIARTLAESVIFLDISFS